ncbi:MAG: FAD-binding oxidoreductase [Gammaproteobacteria bacterium]
MTFARERDLLLAVRGGGHSWPGKSVCESGLMLDLSLMKKVRVDPDAQRAYTAGGALLYGLDRAARQHGLITTAGVISNTGVGGDTLGGGLGRLNHKFGLTIDNLKSAEIVTADGEREAAPLFKIGTPLENSVGLNDYLAFHTKNDGAVHHGIRSYAKSAMIKNVSPEMVKTLREAYVTGPRIGMFTHTAGGAVKRVGELDTAFPYRNAETMLVFAGFWTNPAEDQEVIGAVREYYASLEPFTGGY